MGHQDTFGDRVMKFLGWRETFYTGGRRREFVNIVGTNPDGTENPDDLYLRRYYLYRGPRRPHVYLHHIIRSDYDRACHDHPWDFTSLILKSGYFEYNETVVPGHPGNTSTPVSITIGSCTCSDTPNGMSFISREWRGPGSMVQHKCTDLHRLELKKPAWTLVFTGPRKREWGFFTHDKGWIKWNTLYQYIKDMME